MTKQGIFKKVHFTLENTYSYGRYILRAVYYRKIISIAVTDSEIWDYLDDDSNKEKYNAARRGCYYLIKFANQ